MKKHQQASKKGDEPQRSKGGSSSTRGGVRYGECQKNYAANMGGFALDGCREFMASGEDGPSDALRCAACGCHRSFHGRELDNEETSESSSRTSIIYKYFIND
ncbi:hypothetical protein AAC387_Pa06g3171 [Persea americana]